MIIYTNQRSKKKKNPTKKQRELDASWNELVQKHAHVQKFSSKSSTNKTIMTAPKPYVRETVQYPSLKDFTGNATKPIEGKRYTGDKIIGIGTLHKSNAVPIFTNEDAKDQASMRR
jgi:hypothetical protein